jgi:hypothetical protein
MALFSVPMSRQTPTLSTRTASMKTFLVSWLLALALASLPCAITGCSSSATTGGRSGDDKKNADKKNADKKTDGKRTDDEKNADKKTDKEKPRSREVSFPKQKIEFDLPPGWKIVKKEVTAEQSSCVLTREVDGAVKATVGIWAGESFATEAIAKGSMILYGKKVAKGSPQETAAGAAGANQKVMSLALGRDYQPGTTKLDTSVNVGWKGVGFLAIRTNEGALTGVGLYTGGAGGPLLVGWAFEEGSEEETKALLTRIFEARKPAE